MLPALPMFVLFALIVTALSWGNLEYDPAAFWAMIGVWVTGSVGFVAYHQISETRKSNEAQMALTREENTKERTLNACLLFDHDPVIVEAKKALYEARQGESLRRFPWKHREDLLTMLNYFDVIAIGVSRKIYDEDIARAHLESILRVYLQRFFDDRYFAADDPPLIDDYKELATMAKRWGVLSLGSGLTSDKESIPSLVANQSGGSDGEEGKEGRKESGEENEGQEGQEARVSRLTISKKALDSDLADRA